MPLQLQQTCNVAFKKPPIGKRGYDEDEVDAFLDLIEALARLIEENNDLKQQVDEMQRSVPELPATAASDTAGPRAHADGTAAGPGSSRRRGSTRTARSSRCGDGAGDGREVRLRRQVRGRPDDGRRPLHRRPHDRPGLEQGRHDGGRTARTQAASSARPGARRPRWCRTSAQRDHRRPGAAQGHARRASSSSARSSGRHPAQSYRKSQLRDLDGRGSAEAAVVDRALGWATPAPTTGGARATAAATTDARSESPGPSRVPGLQPGGRS